jgi:hypothetical protein
MLIPQLFSQNNILHEKTEQWPTFPHNQLEGSGIRHNVLRVTVCLQHRILGFANGTTLGQLSGLP